MSHISVQFGRETLDTQYNDTLLFKSLESVRFIFMNVSCAFSFHAVISFLVTLYVGSKQLARVCNHTYCVLTLNNMQLIVYDDGNT